MKSVPCSVLKEYRSKVWARAQASTNPDVVWVLEQECYRLDDLIAFSSV